MLAGDAAELAPATAVFPAAAQGVDFRPGLGRRVTVGYTARIGPDRGASRTVPLTVVALFDPTYQVDGADVAYVDRGTLLRLAAAREGLDPQTVAGVVSAARPVALVLVGVVLAVGVVLGHSIARAAVACRLSEFAILRVLGWPIHDVRRLLVCEGFTLGIAVGLGGAVVGTVLGVALTAPVGDVLSLDLPRSAAVLVPWQYAVCLLLPAVVVVAGTMIGTARSLRNDPYLVAQAQRT